MEMERRKKIIGDFCELISDEMEGAVRETSIQDLGKFRNFLFIRSAKNEIFHSVVKTILNTNPDVEMTFFGNGFDRDFLESLKQEYPQFHYSILVYDGRFDGNRMLEYKKELLAQGKIDAIVFMNYSIHRESYLNIEEVAYHLSDDMRLPIYVLLENGQIYQHLDIKLHSDSIKLYSSILSWFHI